MSQQNQPVGIIEISADPTLDALLDGNIGDTLRDLRRSDAPLSDPNAASCWCPDGPSLPDSVVVLKANLQQLHSELKSELTTFINTLLARR